MTHADESSPVVIISVTPVTGTYSNGARNREHGGILVGVDFYYLTETSRSKQNVHCKTSSSKAGDVPTTLVFIISMLQIRETQCINTVTLITTGIFQESSSSTVWRVAV